MDTISFSFGVNSRFSSSEATRFFRFEEPLVEDIVRFGRLVLVVLVKPRGASLNGLACVLITMGVAKACFLDAPVQWLTDSVKETYTEARLDGCTTS